MNCQNDVNYDENICPSNCSTGDRFYKQCKYKCPQKRCSRETTTKLTNSSFCLTHSKIRFISLLDEIINYTIKEWNIYTYITALCNDKRLKRKGCVKRLRNNVRFEILSKLLFQIITYLKLLKTTNIEEIESLEIILPPSIDIVNMFSDIAFFYQQENLKTREQILTLSKEFPASIKVFPSPIDISYQLTVFQTLTRIKMIFNEIYDIVQIKAFHTVTGLNSLFNSLNSSSQEDIFQRNLLAVHVLGIYPNLELVNVANFVNINA
jgi:hypothetical protein